MISAVRPEKINIRPIPALLTSLTSEATVLMAPMAVNPATRVLAATINTTTCEKPCPMPVKNSDEFFICSRRSPLRISSTIKASANENRVISTRPILIWRKNRPNTTIRNNGISGNRA
ncbi:hypothetical protein D3C76_1350710 [compost metagenome]